MKILLLAAFLCGCAHAQKSPVACDAAQFEEAHERSFGEYGKFYGPDNEESIEEYQSYADGVLGCTITRERILQRMNGK